jgi:NAD(P)H-dependent flavin oxidoreductase YrpB (nitropropane dioxygenase family)
MPRARYIRYMTREGGGAERRTRQATTKSSRPLDRANAFCAKYDLKLPILLAPMAGACPARLSIAVANAGGMGSMGGLITPPAGIRAWVREFRSNSSGPFQLNVWIPDPRPRRDPDAEGRVRRFLAAWGPPVPSAAGDAVPPDFDAQCETFLDLAPTAVSSIMGVFPATFVSRLMERGIAWFATATTLAEAKIARDAGADAIIAQGYEAGGHRGSFDLCGVRFSVLARTFSSRFRPTGVYENAETDLAASKRGRGRQGKPDPVHLDVPTLSLRSGRVRSRRGD